MASALNSRSRVWVPALAEIIVSFVLTKKVSSQFYSAFLHLGVKLSNRNLQGKVTYALNQVLHC